MNKRNFTHPPSLLSTPTLLFFYPVIVVPGDNNPIEDPTLNLPRTENNTKQHKTTTRRKHKTQTTTLTRFGLNAYVLGAIRREINLLWKKITIASSLFECKRAPAFQIYRIQTLETKTAFKYTDFQTSRKIPAPDCRSTGRSTDLFPRSTGRSPGCPTESWALTVR